MRCLFRLVVLALVAAQATCIKTADKPHPTKNKALSTWLRYLGERTGIIDGGTQGSGGVNGKEDALLLGGFSDLPSALHTLNLIKERHDIMLNSKRSGDVRKGYERREPLWDAASAEAHAPYCEGAGSGTSDLTCSSSLDDGLGSSDGKDVDDDYGDGRFFTAVPGIILWSHGRSATSTLTSQFLELFDPGWLCNNHKEGFRNGRDVAPRFIKRVNDPALMIGPPVSPSVEDPTTSVPNEAGASDTKENLEKDDGAKDIDSQPASSFYNGGLPRHNSRIERRSEKPGKVPKGRVFFRHTLNSNSKNRRKGHLNHSMKEISSEHQRQGVSESHLNHRHLQENDISREAGSAQEKMEKERRMYKGRRKNQYKTFDRVRSGLMKKRLIKKSHDDLSHSEERAFLRKIRKRSTKGRLTSNNLRECMRVARLMYKTDMDAMQRHRGVMKRVNLKRRYEGLIPDPLSSENYENAEEGKEEEKGWVQKKNTRDTASDLLAKRRFKYAFTHVKPRHLTHGTSDLRTAQLFFEAASEAGFTVVVAVWRKNQLARMVSSIELHKIANRHGLTKDVKRREKEINLPRLFKGLRDKYEAGIAAANDAGLIVIELEFSEVTNDPCTAANKIGHAAGLTQATDLCEGRDGEMIWEHKKTSQRDQPLSVRVNHSAFARIAHEQLSPLPEYRWMLNLSRENPPEDVTYHQGEKENEQDNDITAKIREAEDSDQGAYAITEAARTAEDAQVSSMLLGGGQKEVTIDGSSGDYSLWMAGTEV